MVSCVNNAVYSGVGRVVDFINDTCLTKVVELSVMKCVYSGLKNGSSCVVTMNLEPYLEGRYPVHLPVGVIGSDGVAVSIQCRSRRQTSDAAHYLGGSLHTDPL